MINHIFSTADLFLDHWLPSLLLDFNRMVIYQVLSIHDLTPQEIRGLSLKPKGLTNVYELSEVSCIFVRSVHSFNI